jgi:hypothetical protein
MANSNKVLDNFKASDFTEFWSYRNLNAIAVTVGSPGSFVGPEGSTPTVPATLAALKADDEIGTKGYAGNNKWKEGQYVVLGDASEAYWNGTDWAVGRAPATPITGVIAGAPGAFTPAWASLPANITALRADLVVGTTAQAGKPSWTTGQYVVLANAAEVHWDGTAWTTGRKP